MFVNNFSALSAILALFLINRVYGNVVYEVPEPKVEVFKKGFRVSIAHEDGVELFAFHGNINVPMHGIEAGQFSKDVLKKCGDYWVFEDKNTKLIIGDTIYFWLFVIRDRLGYRYDDGHFVVKEISESSPTRCDSTPPVRKLPSDIWSYEPETTSEHYIQTRAPISTLAPTIERPEEVEICCDLFLNVTHRIIVLAEENRDIVTENNVLYQLAQRSEDYNVLKIFGKYPEKYYPTPRQFAQNLIKEKLLLDDVKVTEGELIPGGISFKMQNLKDKVRVILASKMGLKGSNYELAW